MTAPPAATASAMFALAAELYPECRSITGDGLRRSLSILNRVAPLTIHEAPTGEAVFDWVIPREWNIDEAWIKDPGGRTVVDFRNCNLHAVNYSAPFSGRLSLAELRPRLHSLPEHPDWIPYRTSYYRDDWGFCLSHRQLESLPEGEYEVHIGSSLRDGSLSYGEIVLAGETDEEVLFSAHSCHPSLANDNLSGMTVAAFLAQELSRRRRRYTYRFVFAPGTIGAIAWLARNREAAGRIRHGLILTCVGDNAGFTYKRSRQGQTELDRAALHALRHCGEPYAVEEFSPYGYDERQYCSPGFNLAVGCLMRSPWGRFPEYHTSADNLQFIQPERLEGALRYCLRLVETLEANATFRNRKPYCEPQLGRYGLYGAIPGFGAQESNMARLWTLNQSDGGHSLLDIAERSGLPVSLLRLAADGLLAAGLLEAC